MTTSRRRRACAAALAVVGALALPAAATAAPNQESIIEDELRMLHSGSEARVAALDDAVALGADTIRVNVQWARYAPAATSTERPAGFDGANPAAYPPGTWDVLADLIAGAEVRGMSVLLTVTGSGPAWASRCGGSIVKRQTCRPRPGMFGEFVRAVGLQFPQVDALVDLERAEPARLAVAAVRPRARRRGARGGRRLPLAGALGHRRAARHAATAATRSCSARPRPSAARPARWPVARAAPEFFLRELFCLDARGRKLRGATAKARGCARFRRLAVTGYAHHPYGRSAAVAPSARVAPGEIGILTSRRLKKVLDQAARAGRIPRAAADLLHGARLPDPAAASPWA